MKKTFVSSLLGIVFLVGCAFGPRQMGYDEEMELNAMLHRHFAVMEVLELRNNYTFHADLVKTNSPKFFPGDVGIFVLLDFSMEAYREAVIDPANMDKVDSSKFTDRVNLKYSSGKEYLAYMKLQVGRWRQRLIEWDEAHYLIIAKGNEISRQHDIDEAQRATQKALDEQNRILRSQRQALVLPPLMTSPATVPPRQPVNCTSQRIGNMISTTCN